MVSRNNYRVSIAIIVLQMQRPVVGFQLFKKLLGSRERLAGNGNVR
jgi:hypothetical protein